MYDSVVLSSLFIAFLWSIQTVAQKHTLKNINHETAFAIFSIAYAVMMIFFIGYHRDIIHKDIGKITKPIILVVVGTTVFSFLANAIYYRILKHHSASLVTALTSTAPLFVALLAFVLFGESIKAKQIAGIAAIIGGISLIS